MKSTKRVPIKFVSFLILPALGFGFAAEAKDLSLEDAKRMVTDSPRGTASQETVNAAEANLETATGMFYPAVNLSHGYMLTNDPVGVFSSKLQQRRFSQSDFAINRLNQPGSVDHWRTRMEIIQPILNSLTDIKNRQAAKHGLRSQEWKHQADLLYLRLNITRPYYAAVALGERSAIAQDGIDRLSRLEKSYQLMEAPTSASTTSYLIAQSIRLELTAQKTGLASEQEKIKNAIKAVLGIPISEEIRLTDPIPHVSRETMASDTDPESRDIPEVRAAIEDAKAAHASMQAGQSTWGPRLDLMAGYNLYTGDYTELETAYDFGVLLTWPIFQGPRSGQNHSSAAQYRMAKEMERATVLEKGAAIRNAEMHLNSTIEEYFLIAQAAEKADRGIDIAQKRYQQGTLPLFNYSESIQRWIQARQELIEARRRVADARAVLEFERGEL